MTILRKALLPGKGTPRVAPCFYCHHNHYHQKHKSTNLERSQHITLTRQRDAKGGSVLLQLLQSPGQAFHLSAVPGNRLVILRFRFLSSLTVAVWRWWKLLLGSTKCFVSESNRSLCKILNATALLCQNDNSLHDADDIGDSDDNNVWRTFLQNLQSDGSPCPPCQV